VDRYRIIDGRIVNRRCEINVAEHCNLSCRACSHLSPVNPKSFVDPAVVLRDLTALSRSYHATVVRMLGGEPLLHPDLPGVVDAVRRSRVCDSITVVTNGLLLPRMKDDFWSTVDAVEVSLYPGRSLGADARQRCVDTARRYGVAIRFHEFDEFQESYSEAGTEDRDLVRRIFVTCNVAHRWRCHNVIDGWFFRCPQGHYIPKILSADPDRRYVDGIRIDDAPAFRDRLLAYLQSPEPLEACANCLGTSGRFGPQEQVRRAEFRERQCAPTEELVHPRLVGSLRVALSRVEASTPRRIVAPVEDALLSPGLIKLVRRTQQATRTLLHRTDRKVAGNTTVHPSPVPARVGSGLR
jgi:organic radical activating enzyme